MRQSLVQFEFHHARQDWGSETKVFEGQSAEERPAHLLQKYDVSQRFFPLTVVVIIPPFQDRSPSISMSVGTKARLWLWPAN